MKTGDFHRKHMGQKGAKRSFCDGRIRSVMMHPEYSLVMTNIAIENGHPKGSRKLGHLGSTSPTSNGTWSARLDMWHLVFIYGVYWNVLNSN